MEFKVEKKEKNMAVITVTVPNDEFRKAVKETYNRDKGKFQLPGFRKGHAPQYMIEKIYGEGVFFEGAVNACINKTWPEASKESGLEIVSRPEIDVTEVGGGKDLVYTGTVAVRPEVVLGEYKGIEVQKADMEVTEADIDEAIGKEQDKNSRLVTVEDRAAENGDTVKINFDGSMDGVAFEGGKGENYPLVLGTGNFIEGFEEQIVGHRTGDAFDVNVTFPENYHAKDLAGKPAVFKCELLEIQRKELPDVNDEFASEVSEFDTLEEYKADLRKKLEDAKMKSAAAQNENNVIAKVCENAQIDIPAPMIEMQTEQMIDDYARRMQSQGLPLDQYMQYTGMTMDKLKEQFRPQAERNLKTRLVLEEVAKAENIQVSEEAVDAEIKKMAEAYKIEPEKMKEYLGDAEKENITMDLKVQEAVDFLVAEAKLV
ncbi:MAG: trigger factor [Stomatobaculum sp.]|nr:trigger factor [Stomatobaculum sp.]